MRKLVVFLAAVGLLFQAAPAYAGVDWRELRDDQICKDLSLSDDEIEVGEKVRARIDAYQFKEDPYRFYWGDGKMDQSERNSATHEYEKPGVYTVIGQLDNPDGEWVGSEKCKETIKVVEKKARGGWVKPVNAQEYGDLKCEIEVRGNLDQTPSRVTVEVEEDGSDTRSVDKYRVDFGDGSEVATDRDGVVRHTFRDEGTYTITASMRVNGQWEEETCSRNVTVANDVDVISMDENPEEGVSWLLLAGSGLSSLVGGSLVVSGRLKNRG